MFYWFSCSVQPVSQWAGCQRGVPWMNHRCASNLIWFAKKCGKQTSKLSAGNQRLLLLRHNMTDAVKVPGESRSGGEERMCGAHAPNIHGRKEESSEMQTAEHQVKFSIMNLWSVPADWGFLGLVWIHWFLLQWDEAIYHCDGWLSKELC